MSKLPLEILKEKYIPLLEFCEKYNVSAYRVNKLIEDKKIRYAEFKIPGEFRRSIHVNYEEVLSVLEEEGV